MANPPDSSRHNQDDDPAAVSSRIDGPERAVRSSIEIAKILQAICDEELELTSYLEHGEVLFSSRVRAVDLDLDRLVFDFSQWKPANAAVMACPSLQFHCDRKGRHIQFVTGAPRQIIYGGVAALRVAFPQFILDLRQRTHRRLQIKSPASLWCVINPEGANAIVADVSDISEGGLGAFVHDSAAALKPGTIFTRCQITGASLKRPVIVNVQVLYVKTVHTPDGAMKTRVGCRFVAPSAVVQQLIASFEAEFDQGGHAP